MRIAYYAVAERSDGKIGQLLVIREEGRQVLQQWTEITYRSIRAAAKDLERLNSGGMREAARGAEAFQRAKMPSVTIESPVPDLTTERRQTRDSG